MSLLELEDVHAYYGNIHALMGVSLKVEPGEIVALIGANGAGKTTTLRAISGLLHPRQGSVLLEGREISHLAPHIVHKAGLGLVPEGRGVFPGLSVLENLEMGAYIVDDKEEIQRGIETAFSLFPRLKERRTQAAETLSGGEQQMLAIGRGLMQDPDLIMFDEPSLGLSPLLVGEIFQIIKTLHSEGLTIFLVEQNVKQTLKVADYCYVIENGRVVDEGTGKALEADPKVREAYLGL